MYKDKDKQREADRARQRRYRAERGLEAYPKGVTKQGVTEGITKGITSEGITDGVLPGAKVVWESEPGAAKKIKELVRGIPKQGYIGAVPETPDTTSPKRGKDIKCFADPKDLPPAVQASIILSKVGVLASIVIGKPGDADYNGVCTEVWRAERGR